MSMNTPRAPNLSYISFSDWNTLCDTTARANREIAQQLSTYRTGPRAGQVQTHHGAGVIKRMRAALKHSIADSYGVCDRVRMTRP